METGVTLQSRILQTIDDHAEDIINLAEEFLRIPEVGYKEFKTSEKVCKVFSELELPFRNSLGITGVRAEGPDHDGPHICLIGELDAVICREHPFADPITGAAHACGHHAQLAALLGAAIGLKASGALDELPGRVSFCALPAEEYIDLAYRRNLREQGAIQQLSGKQEWIARGLFDDVDMAMMVHAHPDTPDSALFLEGKSLGFVEKQIRFTGRAAHASTPEKGINALNAAALAILGMHANRERFRDEDRIRVHPIITMGGTVVNAIPETVTMECYVRGASMEVIQDVNRKVNRALAATAAAMGGNVHLTDVPGYMPEVDDRNMLELAGEAMRLFFDEVYVRPEACTTGCTDMGDVSCVMPSTQFHIPGAGGKSHGEDYRIADPESAAVKAAKVQLVLLAMLLKDDAAQAKRILAEHKPVFASREAYFEAMDNMFLDRQAVSYAENGDVTLSFVKGEQP